MLIFIMVLMANAQSPVRELASVNGFNPDKRIVAAIEHAATVYKLDKEELAAIAIIETGMGKYSGVNKNTNGTRDFGLFQINSINHPKCVEYNLNTPEGNSLCAAKLLSQIKKVRRDYIGVYHSKTKDKKTIYIEKYKKVIAKKKKIYYVSIY